MDERRAEKIADEAIEAIRSHCGDDEDLRGLVANYVYHATALRGERGAVMTSVRRRLRDVGKSTAESMSEALGVPLEEARKALNMGTYVGFSYFSEDGEYRYRPIDER